MREIKFRCFGGYYTMSDRKEDMEMEYYSFKEHNMWQLHELGDESLERLQQFTGLLDKNGKEIYEGDILKIDSWKWVVKYKTLKLSQDGLGIGFDIADRHEFNNGNVEVIGNIYENPELLEEE